MNDVLRDRVRGCVVGAAVGDALGMPLEFGSKIPTTALVREMTGGPLPAGAFTDDTEMALALSDSLLAHRPLDPADLADRFVAWLQSKPRDVGIHTGSVLYQIAAGEPWDRVAESVLRRRPDSAGNGSMMRCWPIAVAHWNDLDLLVSESRLQSRVTHPHPDCIEGCVFVNSAIYYLLRGLLPAEAIARAMTHADLSPEMQKVIRSAPRKPRDALENSGWVRHAVESVVWGMRTWDSFEEIVVQVANLGNDADTSAAIVGAMAGAVYGLSAIPDRWLAELHGEWPLRSGTIWTSEDFVALADRLAETGENEPAGR